MLNQGDNISRYSANHNMSADMHMFVSVVNQTTGIEYMINMVKTHISFLFHFETSLV